MAGVYIAIMEGKRDVHFEVDVEDMSEMGRHYQQPPRRRLQQGSGNGNSMNIVVRCARVKDGGGRVKFGDTMPLASLSQREPLDQSSFHL